MASEAASVIHRLTQWKASGWRQWPRRLCSRARYGTAPRGSQALTALSSFSGEEW